MSSYLSASACCGRRPKHLSGSHCYTRSDLIARLLRERHVARFIVAPDGFGKTSLALGYADTVFSFEHVLWLGAKSPCFLRDLDAGVIASGLLSTDRHAALAVFDDVPALSFERASAFSSQIDALLAAGCEVLVCCAPSCDAYASLQRDRVRLGATDLLLGDDELAFGENSLIARDGSAGASRVAGLRWSEGMTPAAFLQGVVREELPLEVVVPMVVMLVLQSGELAELEAFRCADAEALRMLAAEYPFLGIDEGEATFSAPSFLPADIAKAFGKRLAGAGRLAHHPSQWDLAGSLADALLARGEGGRACEVVGALCPHAQQAAWLEKHGLALARQACALPASDLAGTRGRSASPLSFALEADEAWRAALLGDEAAARRHARKAAASPAEAPQVMGLLMLARLGSGKDRDEAAAKLAHWAAVPLPQGGEDAAAFRWTRPLAGMWDLADQPAEGAQRAWEAWRHGGAHPDALSIAALWLFRDTRRQLDERRSYGAAQFPGFVQQSLFEAPREAPADRVRGRLLASAAEHVARRFEHPAAARPDAFSALACLSWDELCRVEGFGSVLDAGWDRPRAVRAAEPVRAFVLAQRSELAQRRRRRERKRAEYAATHPDAFLDARRPLCGPAVAERAPLLTVNLFGGLDVRLGDDPVDPRAFRRQKVKVLLALMALNRGRDLSRERLMEVLWPGMPPDSARKSFYTVWSLLKKAISLPSGACPYLIRQRSACRLDGTLLRTDLADFDDVCRSLHFDALDGDGWVQVSVQVEQRFSGEIMPGDSGTAAIERARSEYRLRMVDALVAASRRLVAQRRAQEGLWFARAAFKRSSAREDVYTALMEAQLAAGQRSSALETYFACRKYLVEELGIDPSLETMALYRSIIESEEGLEAW